MSTKAPKLCIKKNSASKRAVNLTKLAEQTVAFSHKGHSSHLASFKDAITSIIRKYVTKGLLHIHEYIHTYIL